jgi:hypothetical protein
MLERGDREWQKSSSYDMGKNPDKGPPMVSPGWVFALALSRVGWVGIKRASTVKP